MPMIEDIPGEKGRLLVAADRKLLGCQIVPFHGIFPGNPGLRHIQKNAGQPTVSPGQNRLEQHLLGLVMAEMDIRGPGKSRPEAGSAGVSVRRPPAGQSPSPRGPDVR